MITNTAAINSFAQKVQQIGRFYYQLRELGLTGEQAIERIARDSHTSIENVCKALYLIAETA